VHSFMPLRSADGANPIGVKLFVFGNRLDGANQTGGEYYLGVGVNTIRFPRVKK